MIVFGLPINLTFLEPKKGHVLAFSKLVCSAVTRTEIFARCFFFFLKLLPVARSLSSYRGLFIQAASFWIYNTIKICNEMRALFHCIGHFNN
jgi:hypothetical protein